MKRKKKISVTYTERPSKKEGMQGICRIVHDGVSTMFKIGVVDVDNTKNWFEQNKAQIQKVLETERDALKDSFTVLGFHYRWDIYSGSIEEYLYFRYVVDHLSWDLSEFLTIRQRDVIDNKLHGKLTDTPPTLDYVHELIISPELKNRQGEIMRLLNNYVYRDCIVYQLFASYTKTTKDREFTCLDLLFNDVELASLFNEFLKGFKPAVDHLEKGSFGLIVREIVTRLNLEEYVANYTGNHTWLQDERAKLINNIIFLGNISEVKESAFLKK